MEHESVWQRATVNPVFALFMLTVTLGGAWAVTDAALARLCGLLAHI